MARVSRQLTLCNTDFVDVRPGSRNCSLQFKLYTKSSLVKIKIVNKNTRLYRGPRFTNWQIRWFFESAFANLESQNSYQPPIISVKTHAATETRSPPPFRFRATWDHWLFFTFPLHIARWLLFDLMHVLRFESVHFLKIRFQSFVFSFKFG